MSASLPGRIFRVLYTVWCLEAGAFLTMVPWSRVWSQIVVGRAPSSLEALLDSPWFRGFVSGVGLIHVGAAAVEVEAWRRSVASRVPSTENGGSQ